uniref:hydantoinase/oxoprolinase family protein n=1 Tax=Yoonia sp. TaxID=2212373 RepID=UPI004048DB7E
AFLHAYLNPAHEDAVAGLARDIGYTQISTSHGVSRLAKLVGRGDTTVVDAYLSPILRRYVDLVAGALDVGRVCERLLFMQSNGGLTDARLFQGKDAILSGPAGGIVGMVKTAQAAGFSRLRAVRPHRRASRSGCRFDRRARTTAPRVYWCLWVPE